ncbi:hypothetical protein GCM10022393_15340 [Aquimarina addita]|uniref:Phosphoribosylpyrophosphate synthetase n=1 Tax=Aquimarina addita TaxID=870485 RepID=A0ABP7XH64_9FLAO
MNEKSEKDIITAYEQKGYTCSFRYEKECLVENASKKAFSPEQIFVVAEHRFEGMSNPSDMSILYVLETNNNLKGTLLIGYGPTGNLELSDFFNKIPTSNFSNKENIFTD